MSYITNIDTLSALLDRLISENIKLYFFRKDGIDDNIQHQEEVISKIKHRISQLLTDVYENKKYDYVSELRTYKPDDIVETLEELNIQGREIFMKNGGVNFDYIPCLNDNNDWIDFLAKYTY